MSINLISCRQAKDKGLTRYYTGNPCKYGHMCERHTSDGGCVECRRERSLAWGAANMVRRNGWEKERRDANPELHRRYAKKWRQANPEKQHKRTKEWRATNPGAKKVSDHARRARKRGAEGRYNLSDLHSIMEKQGLSCYCGVSFLVVEPTIDHVTPLSRGGSNWPDNLQLLCGPCNCSKHNKLMDEWKKAA